ncbi:hypothetical protein [Xanthomonas sp. MUS 060]|uniref:hypothetical protein n=1 Tax=Xanthomonas sp. MUS 060 TaxID=1588031 RepID=UPI001F251726|nr:hypothetical protein [Xanthomonas sp. MUS 060]
MTREERNIGKAVVRAAAKLPPGWNIHIVLHRGNADVRLFLPHGKEVFIDNDDKLFSAEINSAIDAAMAAQTQEVRNV